MHPPEGKRESRKAVRVRCADVGPWPGALESGGLCLSFVSTGVSKGKGGIRHRRVDPSCDPREESFIVVIPTPIFAASRLKRERESVCVLKEENFLTPELSDCFFVVNSWRFVWLSTPLIHQSIFKR